MTQLVSWLAFAQLDAHSDALVHFYPAARGLAVPYPVECRVTLFGVGGEPRTVMLEGARMSQPDGVRLRDIFEIENAPNNGMAAVRVQLSTNQSKMNLSASRCLLEFIGEGACVKYWPSPEKSAEKEAAARTLGSALALRDAYLSSSLVIVNGLVEALEPRFVVDVGTEVGMRAIDVGVPAVAGRGLVEVGLDAIVAPSAAQNPVRAYQTSWGLVRRGVVRAAHELPLGVAAFVVYRDVVSNRPVSVIAL